MSAGAFALRCRGPPEFVQVPRCPVDKKATEHIVDIETQSDATQLADRDFDFLCSLIYEQSRIHLGHDKKVLVASRLAKRLRQLRLPDYHS